MKTETSHDPVAPIRQAHWGELAEQLGQPVPRVQATLQLYLDLLAQMGYRLTRTSSPSAVSELPPGLMNRGSLFSAIEAAIINVTQRRLAGERISDQAEVREIQTAVEGVLFDGPG